MSILRSKLTLVVSVTITAVFGMLVTRTFVREHKIEKQIALVGAQIAKAEKQNSELAGLIEYFSQPEHLEKEARIRLNLKKPGERVLVFSPEPKPLTEAPIVTVRTTPFSFASVVSFFRSLVGDDTQE